MLTNISPRRQICAILFICSGMVGCTTGIKEGLHTLKGSSGKIVLIKGESETLETLAYEYGSFKVEPFVSDVGDTCPQEFLDQLPSAIENALAYKSRSLKDRIRGKDKEELGPFFTGPVDKTLLIKGSIIQYEVANLVDKAASPMDEAICRVQIYDAADNLLLAEANCTGRTKSRVRSGPEELAKGVAKALKKLLKPKKEKSEDE